MPANCPYCGATLNFGLKFCVVCGRHTSQADISKLGGGLRGGMKQADMTRRLDDNISAADFERARRPTRLKKHLKTISERVFFIFIGVALIFCLVRVTLQTFFPGKIHGVLEPLLGKNTAIVEQALTGYSEEDKKPTDQSEDDDASKEKPAPSPPKPKKHGHHGAHHHAG